jgi:hypothetical protein
VHRTVLATLVHLRGGLAKMGGQGFFKELVLGFEALYTLTEKSDPIYGKHYYLPAYPSETSPIAVVTKIPSKFSTLSNSQIISRRLLGEVAKASGYHTGKDFEISNICGSLRIVDYLNEQNSCLSIDKYLVLICVLYVLEMSTIFDTRFAMEASFALIFDRLMDHFIAYAHQVDLGLNGTVSSNSGSSFPIKFFFGSPLVPLDLASSSSSPEVGQLMRSSPPFYGSSDLMRGLLYADQQPDTIQVYHSHAEIMYSQPRLLREQILLSTLASDTIDRLLSCFLRSKHLQARWAKCWQGSQEKLCLGPRSYLPWMLLTDRVFAFTTSDQ